LTAAIGCRRAAESPRQTPQADNQPGNALPNAPQVHQSVRDLIGQLPFVEKERQAGMLRAWARVPRNSRFRIAQPGDFENPSMTSEYGEIAGANGLAVLIVDTTAADHQGMSLIIFIERPGHRSDIYWIYRDMDLSKYRMSRSSGDILVERPKPDQGSAICEIQWDRSLKQWTCKGW
jgi:hypothetical protein